MIASPQYTHPHPQPAHVMRRYRDYILGCKRKWGSARGLIHYREIVNEYRAAKALHLRVRATLSAGERDAG